MSELETFRNHARAMAEPGAHKPTCPDEARYGVEPIRRMRLDGEGYWDGWEITPAVAPTCFGCVTDADRALWARLADECDAWLNREDETQGALL